MRVVKMGEVALTLVGATGRVLAAYCSDDELNWILDASRSKLHIDRMGLRRRLLEKRAHGFDVAHGERIVGSTAAAAPIFDVNGKVAHCLCVLGLSVQIDDRTDGIIEELLIATNKISVQMGYVRKAKTLAPTPWDRSPAKRFARYLRPQALVSKAFRL